MPVVLAVVVALVHFQEPAGSLFSRAEHKLDAKTLPEASINRSAGEATFKHTTPGFEAMAWRLGQGELKFNKMETGEIVLRHNGKRVNMDASHAVEMGRPGHLEYVRAADDRLGGRMQALAQFLKKTDEAKLREAIDDVLLAEYQKLRAAAQAGGDHRQRELDLLLFRWMEGPEAYLPTKAGLPLREVLEKAIWFDMPAKGRFSRNARLDQSFRAFHTKILIGPDGDDSNGRRRNNPLPEWGMN
ncbi:MAG: hypothetical protein ACKO26_05870 [Planctomycetota bacterium]